MMRSLLCAGLATVVFMLGMFLVMLWRQPSTEVSRGSVPPAVQGVGLTLAATFPAENGKTAMQHLATEHGRAQPAENTHPESKPFGNPFPEDNPQGDTEHSLRGDLIEESNPPATASPDANRRNHPHAASRLAIVIDDLGHNQEATRLLLAMGLPFTFSILPNRPHSQEVMHLVRAAGHEFMVHIPMEPQGYPQANPGRNALMLAMDEAATRASLKVQLASLPGAVGANNHMGSAYTANAGKMRIVQDVVASRGLLFLNSRTSGTQVPGQIARERGYPYLERDVFLDHDPDLDSIRAQLARVVAQARRQGQAIAIGHPYPETLRVLREDLPHLLRQGIVVVPITQLQQ